MTVELVFGGLAKPKANTELEANAKPEVDTEPKADVLLTFRPGGLPLGLDVPLAVGARAIIASIFAGEGHQYLPGPNLSSIRVCPAPWCALFSFVDFSPPPSWLGPGTYTYRAPRADPLGVIIATALAYWAEESGIDAAVEAYANNWPRYCSALDALRGLKTLVIIYTSYYDQRYICYDKIDVRHIPMDTARVPKPWSQTNETYFTAPQIAEPPLDREALELTRRVWEAGGFLLLKAAKEWSSDNAITKAVAMGFLTYSKYDMTLRITESGIAALQAYKKESGAKTASAAGEEAE